MKNAIIEPLIDHLPYNDLIAMAGTCRKIRSVIQRSQRWKNILTEWKRPLKTPHALVIKRAVHDEIWYKINARINSRNAYARVIKRDADEFFTLQDVVVVTYVGQANNPISVFHGLTKFNVL